MIAGDPCILFLHLFINSLFMFKKTFSSVALACFMAGATLSPLVTLAQTKTDAKLPVDPKVKMGKLPNGLTYYIRPNSKPEKKVELRLIVDAGSILENDDQQGLAHFMEHMNFNGTKNYPKNKLVDFLQSIGVEFGADLNAETGFDHTVYILPIPTDKPGNLESGFQVIEDWAHNANLTEQDINEERGVVLEESRSGKGAEDRMSKKFLPKLFAGSQYAERLPIGKDDILKTFKPEAIRSFYRDWYRPNLMAVAVVGDITIDQAEALIKKHFAGLKNPAQPRPRKDFGLPAYTQSAALVITDKEATNYRFQLVFSSHKARKQVTIGDYREDIVKSLFTSMLNRRYQELTQSANPPFAIAAADMESFIRNEESFGMIAIPTGSMETAVNTSIAELVKARDFGFTASELEIVKKQVLSGVEKQYNERNTTESGRLIDEYVRNFTDQEPIPGIENEYRYYQDLIPGITIDEVNALSKKWLSKENTGEYFTFITGPDSKQMKLPTDMELKDMVDAALSQKVTANAEKTVAKQLLDKEPVAGKITGEVVDKELGATTFTLSNGVKVTVKKTDFKSDEIIMTAVKKGGSSNYGPEDKSNTKFLSQVIESMGYGSFTPTALTDFLSGKTLELTPAMGDVSSELKGKSSVKDLESLMQLTYLQLTEPRKDDGLLSGFLSTMKMQVQFLGSNPQVAFIDSVVKFVYHNDPRRPIAVPTAADLEKINVDRCLDIYKSEFGNADGFHFFIVGNVDENTLKPLLEKYIASLPTKGTKPAFKDNGLRPIAGSNRLDFKKGQEQKSLVMTMYNAEVPYTESLDLQADMVGQILTIKVLEQIREQMGAMYSGGMSGDMTKFPYPHFTIQGGFPCGPENVEPIVKKADEEIADIRTKGPEQKDLDKVKLAITEKRKESLKTNGYWSDQLERVLFWDFSKDFFLNYDKEMAKVTAADIKGTAGKMFSGSSLVGVLNPEKIEPVKDTKAKSGK